MDREGGPVAAPRGPGEIETRAELARELTALRTRAGLTIRALATRLDIPPATVGGYFSGRHLPGPAQLDAYCALLRDCAVPETQLGEWVEALTRVRLASDARVSRITPPYRGLEPFRMQDAAVFFGREAVTETVLARLAGMRHHQPGGNDSAGMLIVLGPSGSGKSSLLSAGVGAGVEAGALGGGGNVVTALLTPGQHPAATLRTSLRATAGSDRLIVIDQLEEIFAVDAAERMRFFAELARLRPPQTLIVCGLRTDFFEVAAREPLLLEVLRREQVILGPMTREELRRAIVEPAQRAGVLVEDGLLEVLLADLAPGSPSDVVHEAGALPLLSHALLVTWTRAMRNQLTIADYRSAGGLRGAISQSAEDLYATLTPGEQRLAERIFRRLVRVADDAPLTRRTVARGELEELAALNGDARAASETPAGVLDRFVAARLITADAGTVKLSHEAVLTAWPRLARWLERDRAALRMHNQITDAAKAWLAADRDSSLLLRGTRLQLASEWAGERGRRADLTGAEQQFLDAGEALASGEREASRRRTRRTQQLLGAVALLAVAAAVLAVIAFHAQRNADTARDQALSRQVAIEAADLEPSDPALAMQLALTAYRVSRTTQATSALLDASASEMPTRILGPIGPTAEALSGTGSLLAVAHSATDRVSLYTLSGERPTLSATVTAGPSSAQLFAVALSPDGRLLAAGTTSGQVVLWRLALPSRPVRITTLKGIPGTVYAVAFNSTGRLLAAVDSAGSVTQWSLSAPSDPRERSVLVAPGHPSLQAVSYSPNGAILTAVGSSGRLIQWRVGAARPLSMRTVTQSTLTSVAYSPNGRTLAAGGQDGLVHLWRIGARGALRSEHPPLGGFTSWVDSLAFSPDSRYLAAGDSDSSLRIWSSSDWSELATLRHPAPVTGVLFTPDERSLITVDEDGTTRIWSFPPPAAVREPGNVYTVDYTANGDELAAVSGGPDGNVDLWNVANPWRPAHLAAVRMPASFGPAAGVESLSPDGKVLAVGNAQAKVRLVGLSTPRRPDLLGGALTGATPYIEQLNFSPDMKLLTVGDDAGRIQIWSVADPARATRIADLNADGHSSQVLGIDFSPDGRLLAVACADHHVALWDLADPRHAKLLAVLGGFSSYAYTVAFTPNGRTLIAGSADESLRLWDISDPADPRLLGSPLTGPTSTVYDIAVSPNGSTLAAGTTDQDVWIWSITDPTHPVEIADLQAASGQVFDVTFSPNGQTLLASGGDQTLHFWNYHPSAVASRICSRAGDPITRREWSQYVPGAAYAPPCR
jgi:WD40 repeat protein/transcriptional regulator with XRE-family HTH domain